MAQERTVAEQINLYQKSIEEDPDYDYVDRLINGDPITLGRQYRSLLIAYVSLHAEVLELRADRYHYQFRYGPDHPG